MGLTTAALIAGWKSRFLSALQPHQSLAVPSGLLPLTADCLMEFTEEPSLSSPSDTLPEGSPAQAALCITRTSWVINPGSLWNSGTASLDHCNNPFCN